MTTDLPTMEQRWEIIEPALAKAGIDKSKINTTLKRGI
jgi:hypothetical protein